jgi:hypothetical protein
MNRCFALPVAILALFITHLSQGAEVKIEGILKAINAEERTMTVERKANKEKKEVSLEVAEEAGDLKHLKAGDEVTVAYDSTLEVVTKIVSPAHQPAWLFYDFDCQGLTLEKGCQIVDESEARFPGNRGGVMLVTSEPYDTFIFRCEFYYEDEKMEGNPFVGIGCAPPNLKGTTLKDKWPKGIEVKLWHRGFGSLLLPDDRSKAELIDGQKREGRAVFPLKQQVPVRNGWSSLEIEVKNDKTVLVKGNGVLLNTIGQVESTKGRLIMFPPSCAFHVRNASVEVEGKKTPLSFEGMTVVSCK